MSDLALSLDTFTYEDYKSWDDGIRCELIDGVVFMMSAPSIWHQDISMSLSRQLGGFFDGKNCKPFAAPVDVRLFPKSDESDDIVVQPDLIVVCDKDKLSDGKACRGAPDLVIEILSEATKLHDLNVKRELYKKAGVREYWIVGSEAARVHTFEASEVRDIDFKESKEIGSLIFPGLALYCAL
jgi:Uma2 family endonuclease